MFSESTIQPDSKNRFHVDGDIEIETTSMSTISVDNHGIWFDVFVYTVILGWFSALLQWCYFAIWHTRSLAWKTRSTRGILRLPGTCVPVTESGVWVVPCLHPRSLPRHFPPGSIVWHSQKRKALVSARWSLCCTVKNEEVWLLIAPTKLRCDLADELLPLQSSTQANRITSYYMILQCSILKKWYLKKVET